jgi:predicted transcriptional regulator
MDLAARDAAHLQLAPRIVWLHHPDFLQGRPRPVPSAGKTARKRVAPPPCTAYTAPVSITEILEELPRLPDAERQVIFRRLIELDAGANIEETPEMLAAIDAGIRSMATGPYVPLEEARQRIAGWITR